MKYAEVAVNAPGCRSTFCYAIPPRLDVEIGQAVWVPFGPRVIQGILVKLCDEPSVEATREIADIITYYPSLSSIQIELAQWISDYYLSPPFDATALMLPPGFERRTVTYFQPAGPEVDLSFLNPEQIQVLRFIEKEERVSLNETQRKFGISKAKRITDQLLRRQLVIKSQKLEKPRVRPKTVLYVEPAVRRHEVESQIAHLNKSRAYKQAELLEFLTGQAQPVPVSEVKKRLNCSYATIRALESRHLISTKSVNIRRDPLFHLAFIPTPAPVLTPSQQAAWESIHPVIASSQSPESSTFYHSEGVSKQPQSPPVFLLFGVTGSGKTEIYLQALTQVISAGKRGICLIPEIALTPQTVERFANRFPGRVAVLHSGLSLGEQLDEWQWIREGNCDVVVGPRSALFAPQPDLGLIIIDEEHEWTYKQEDKSPRYHARDVALKLARLSGAVVILGSATPDIESFHKAQLGEYQLIELKERITPHGYSPLPRVKIVDMKEELKAGNTGLFSRSLLAAMKGALERNEQVILFLNRRGTSTFIRCRNCGFVFRCPRCSVALTYHSVEKKLICHRCRYSIPVPQICPQCSSRYLSFLGIGTQRVEEEIRRLFPRARFLRWDKDVVTRRHAHEELLKTFRDHEADVLIGTQMIAKGLDLPQVTLAGIISADTGLNFPDFRAGERTFQLLCQIAGRAGRGVKAGNVIIQTYSPENYAIKAASRHDYVGFYHQEINYRRQFNYPPFSHFIRLIYTHTNNDLCRREAERMSRVLLEEKESRHLADLNLIGPVPAFASRVRGRYRWQIILRGRAPAQALSGITLPQGWTVDVSPVGVT
ncbi:MAG: primosomal protein N' [Dehalococcoidia bacterium]|nr:primosomal protein N' [Dehalococcoidia bacterium]